MFKWLGRAIRGDFMGPKAEADLYGIAVKAYADIANIQAHMSVLLSREDLNGDGNRLRLRHVSKLADDLEDKMNAITEYIDD